MPKHAAGNWNQESDAPATDETVLMGGVGPAPQAHAGQSAPDGTAEYPRQAGRPETLRRDYVPYRQQSAYPQVQPVESPEQTPYQAPGYGSGPVAREAGRAGGRLLSLLLTLLALVLRLAAMVLSLLVVANAFVAGSWRIRVVSVTAWFTSWLPSPVSGILVFETPFGGVLRGDFVIAAIVLFVVDWLLTRKAKSLRWG